MLKRNKPVRVLHVVSAMNRGGVESLLMNVYRNLDTSKIQFDFVSHRQDKCDYDDEINSLGGRVFRISSLGQVGPASYVNELKRVMSSNDYGAVHVHTDYQSGFPALAAKLAGVKRRICHSHSNYFPKGNGLKERSILKVLQTIIHFSATDYCACSNEAAHFLFGKKTVDRKKVHVLRNGIEVNTFTSLDAQFSSSLRQELNIPMDAKLIGHVGTFSKSKNQAFTLKIIKRLLEKNKNTFIILVGDGPLRKQIEEEAKELGVFSHIRFLGVRSDIPRLMKAFDVFLFPSLFEGFGIVAIEAQCAGTPCILSDSIPKSTDMGLGLVSYLNLADNIETWCFRINQCFLIERPKEKAIFDQISKRGYNIQDNLDEWLSLYGA